MQTMHSHKLNALAVLAFFLLLYSVFSIGHFGGDGYEDYLTAESIILDGNLSINDRPGDEDELDYISARGVTGRDGKTYSSRGSLGMPLILAIFYFIGNLIAPFYKNIPHDFITMFFCSFVNPFISALNCFLVFIICGHLKLNTKIAIAVTFIYGLTTMVAVYTRTGFSGPALVLFMLLTFYFLLKYKDNANMVYLVCAGICTSLLVFVKTSGLIFVPVFIFYAIWIILEKQEFQARLRGISVFSIFFLTTFLLVLLYNYWIYGSLFNFGKSNVVYYGERIMASAHFLKGLYYYLLSPGKGFFIFNPILLLSMFVLFHRETKWKKEKILFIAIFIINLLFYVKSFRRGSLFSWGPRYLLPSIPFLIFFTGDYIQRYKNFLPRLFLIVLSTVGFFITLPCMFINQSKFYFFVKEKLNLPEYMINFIPDLSPILGAWKMFMSGIILSISKIDIPFIYNPDYRLVPKIISSMRGYNDFDFWFLKIIKYAPEYQSLVFVLLGVMVLGTLISFLAIVKTFTSITCNEG